MSKARVLLWLVLTGLLLAGCGPQAPAAPSSTPTEGAAAFQQDGPYPVRYYHTEAPVSLEPPAGWEVSEDTDGSALAVFTSPGLEASIWLTWEAAANGTQASEQNLRLVNSWLGAEVGVEQEQVLNLDSGETGYIRAGLNADSRMWGVATQVSGETALHLLYLSPPGPPAATYDAFVATARSLRLEPAEPIEFDRNTTLSLDAGESPELDPALTRYGGPDGAVGDLFRGLVVLDPSLQVRPALAEDWQVSPDGAVYTFHLHPEARFHNGRPVTAADVVFSWERAASPELASPTVMTYMSDIAGLAAYHRGEAESIAGLKVLDDRTLQVTLQSPRLTFLHKLTYPVSWVVDRYNVGFPDWEKHPNGTGPYRVLQHLEDTLLLLEANPGFIGGPPAIAHVRYLMYAGYTQQLYEQGEVDGTYVTRDQISRVEDPLDGLRGTLLTEPAMCTWYVTLNTASPPFDDPRVRQALARSVDRQRYVEALTSGEDAAAVGLLPPGMPGYGASLDSPGFDPDGARALLSQSRYGAGGLPEIVWTVPTSGGYASPAVAFLADTWQRELGLAVTLEGIEWEDYYARLDAGDYGQILLEGWCADYPDAENFLETLFHSESALNRAHYANAEFDALVVAARSEGDASARLELFRQAEQLLLDDSPAIFLTHDGPSFQAWKPYVGGYVPTAIGVPQHHSMWLGE